MAFVLTQTKIEKMQRLVIALLFLPLGLFAQKGSITGVVRDAKTGEELIGAAILLEGTTYGASTDFEGRYTINGIPPKSYNISCSYVGYKNLTRYNVIIRSEGNPQINFKLEEASQTLGEVVVTQNPFDKLNVTPLSIQKLSQEEVATYPGGNNDIAKVVQTLPGVSGSVGGFRNDVIIRGGAPNENVYYLDGIEIPNINHFSTQGSAGGPVGLLNVSFFEGVTLSASSFDARYDNVLSGALQFDQRIGNSRDLVGNFRLSSSEAAFTVEGPLLKGDQSSSNTTYIASVRRSYLQLLFGVIGLPFLPDYWDFQYKINHKPDDYNTINFIGVGSLDDLKINEMQDLDAEQRAIQEQIPVIRQKSNTTGISWKHRFRDNSGFLRMALSNNSLWNSFYRYRDNVNEAGLYLQNDSRETETRLRTSITKFLGEWSVSGGLLLLNADYTNQTQNLINDLTYATDLNFYRFGLYGQSSRKLLDDRMSVSFGLRTDGNSFTETGYELNRTLSPRASLSYALDSARRLTFNTSVGRYFKILPYTVLGYQDRNGEYANKSAEYIRSDHFVAGLEYLLTDNSRFSVEGFYKGYDNYPVSLIDSISLANKGGGFEVFGNENIASDGRGRSYGVELLYQQKFTGNYYAIAAFTFYRTEFTGFDRTNFVPAVWDNQLLISLLGGYKLKRNWEVSMRYRLLGPAPFPAVDQEATLANYPAVIRDYSQLGEQRLDPFSQLDFRVDKKWSFEKWSLDLFIDVQNVLGQALPAEPAFGLERNEEGNVINPPSLVQVNTVQTGVVLPSLGLVLNF